jgi:hypothetical protein
VDLVGVAPWFQNIYSFFDGFKKDSGKEPTGNEETKEEQNITCCHHLGLS